MNFDAYRLGATLYMPIVHQKVADIVTGSLPAPSSSIILCLEDALSAQDVPLGVRQLRWVMENHDRHGLLQLFVRPRSIDMASDIAGLNGSQNIAGVVAPKVTPANAPDWLDWSAKSGIQIMPTLESAKFFDPAKIIAIRDIFDSYDRSLIAAVRIGGNDLLATLALRRQKQKTAWEGPLSWVLSMIASILIPAGYPVAAPVFDIIDDLATLKREVDRDVASGFISKTAVHPSQVSIIEDAMRVSNHDISCAQAVLDDAATAVFQIDGAMYEPMTHRAWAKRIMARAKICGITDEIE